MALGEDMISKGFISREQLEQALGEQGNNPGVRLGDLIVKLGMATREQVEEAAG